MFADVIAAICLVVFAIVVLVLFIIYSERL